MKFRKTVIIEAFQFTSDNWREALEFVGPDSQCWTAYTVNDGWILHIPTLEGMMKAMKGDWIIRGVKGEYYPCKSDIFAVTYEKVEE